MRTPAIAAAFACSAIAIAQPSLTPPPGPVSESSRFGTRIELTQATAPGDQGEALLAHPALAALYPPDRRILLPERLTVCGGPSLPEAIDWLASEARRVTEGP